MDIVRAYSWRTTLSIQSLLKDRGSDDGDPRDTFETQDLRAGGPCEQSPGDASSQDAAYVSVRL
jgi:hypothetical protein